MAGKILHIVVHFFLPRAYTVILYDTLKGCSISPAVVVKKKCCGIVVCDYIFVRAPHTGHNVTRG